jgi:hypothetical protein
MEEDFQGNSDGPMNDPTAIGQEIGKAIKEAIEPLIDRLDQITSRMDGPAASENITRYAQATGQSTDQASQSVAGIRDSVLLTSIRDKMDEIRDEVAALSTTIASSVGGG